MRLYIPVAPIKNSTYLVNKLLVCPVETIFEKVNA